MDGDSSSRTGDVRNRHHQEAAGSGGSRKDGGMGLSYLREGPGINSKAGQMANPLGL